MKKLLGLVSAFFLLAMLTACSGGKPEDVAIEFIEAATKGNADKMITLIYIPESDRKQAGLEEMVKGKTKSAAAEMKSKAEQRGGVKSISVEKSDINEEDGRARVTVITEFKNAGVKPMTDNLRLIKNDGKWQVSL